MKRWAAVLAAWLGLASLGCGYHIAGHAAQLPENVKIIAVPGFINQTQTYRVEQTLTAAVIREFVTRTHYHIANDGSDADATLRGTILSTYTAPLTYDSQTGAGNGGHEGFTYRSSRKSVVRKSFVCIS